MSRLKITLCITLIITNKCTYIKFHIKTLKIAPTCFDPKIILRELRCSLLKSLLPKTIRTSRGPYYPGTAV